MSSSNRCDSTSKSHEEQFQLLDKLGVIRIQGRDKSGRPILRIIAKLFPARIVSVDVVEKYLAEKIFPQLEKLPFSVLYVHTDVEKSRNFPGISALRSIHDAFQANGLQNLDQLYFLHPGLQAKLFFSTVGRFMFPSRLYGKLRCVSRVDYLWDHVKRNEIELPEFVYDHEEDLEYLPMMDYGLESDHARVYGALAVDYSPAATYSTRCI